MPTIINHIGSFVQIDDAYLKAEDIISVEHDKTNNKISISLTNEESFSGDFDGDVLRLLLFIDIAKDYVACEATFHPVEVASPPPKNENGKYHISTVATHPAYIRIKDRASYGALATILKSFGGKWKDGSELTSFTPKHYPFFIKLYTDKRIAMADTPQVFQDPSAVLINPDDIEEYVCYTQNLKNKEI